MKKTNLLLAASIATLLSGCGGSSTPATPAVPTTENSAMALPDNITLARESNSANLASINYAAFDDVGTDYSNQSQEIWVNDGDYEALDIINGVMKIMTFTKATDLANKGTYKILYNDPFQEEISKQEAFVEVTRADTNSTTPMYVKFLISEDWGDGPLTRLVHVKINSGKSDTAPMGSFEMNMILLDNEDYLTSTLAEWETAAKANSDPFFETMTIEISPDATTANQTNIQFEMIMDGEDNMGYYNSQWYNKVHLAANFVTTGSMDGGHGWMLKEMAVDANDYSYFDELYPAFDDKYIADRVGRTAEPDQGEGLLSFRSEFDETDYLYKLFDTEGASLNNGNTISSFGFQEGDDFGWIGTNYAGTNNSATGKNYSAKYYHDTDLAIDDKITNFWSNVVYTVLAVDTDNKLVDLENSSSQVVSVGGWEEATVNGDTFYKNADTLVPGWSDHDSNINTPKKINQITGDDVDVVISSTSTSTSYKVKRIIIQKTRKQIVDTDDANNPLSGYTQLKDFADLSPADASKVEALTDKIADLDSITQNSGLDDFDSSVIETTYAWYRDTVKGKKAAIPLRVVDGQVISTE